MCLSTVVFLGACGSGDGPTGTPNPAGKPTTIVLVSGDAQTGPANGPLSVPLVVEVQNAEHVALSGVRVNFAATAGGGTISPQVVTTGADGRASANWTLGDVPGPNEASATVGTLAPARFTATGEPVIPTAITIVSGNLQNAPAGTPLPVPLVVKVTGAKGVPVSRVVVSFAVADGEGSVSAPEATTDKSGLATVTWTLGAAPGPNTLNASVHGLDAARFSASARAIAKLTLTSGNIQLGQAGEQHPTPISVRVEDVATSAPLPGTKVEFKGTGTFENTSVTTDGTGSATTRWTLDEGPNEATIQVVGAAPITLKATGVKWKRVESGWDHTCALTSTGQAYCWGANGLGELGDGTTINPRRTPVPVATTATFKFITAGGGGNFNCVLNDQDQAWCWGSHRHGQTGDGTPQDASPNGPKRQPVPVAGGHTWRSINVDDDVGCAVTFANVGYCWGSNTNGSLANGGSTNDISTPAPISGNLALSEIVPGQRHTCALTTTRALYCWGRKENWGAPVGVANVPTPVSTPLKFKQLALGWFHTCGLTDDGKAWCWGTNDRGQLGDGTTTDRTAPTAVSGGLSFVSLHANGSFTCGLEADGKAWCWGKGDKGELGTGQPFDSSTPARVSSDVAFQQISVGAEGSCGLTTRGSIYCWGPNNSGQVGDGTQVIRPVPTPIKF